MEEEGEEENRVYKYKRREVLTKKSSIISSYYTRVVE